VRGSRSKEPDNDVDISGPVQAIIEAAQHNTLADNPEEAQEELSEQQKKELDKKERIRLKQIEDAIIASTQKTKDALDKTLQEIMTGVEVKDGKN
jgi:pyocin large subunit-like protein